jgi:hypothetical protein
VAFNLLGIHIRPNYTWAFQLPKEESWWAAAATGGKMLSAVPVPVDDPQSLKKPTTFMVEAFAQGGADDAIQSTNLFVPWDVRDCLGDDDDGDRRMLIYCPVRSGCRALCRPPPLPAEPLTDAALWRLCGGRTGHPCCQGAQPEPARAWPPLSAHTACAWAPRVVPPVCMGCSVHGLRPGTCNAAIAQWAPSSAALAPGGPKGLAAAAVCRALAQGPGRATPGRGEP